MRVDRGIHDSSRDPLGVALSDPPLPLDPQVCLRSATPDGKWPGPSARDAAAHASSRPGRGLLRQPDADDDRRPLRRGLLPVELHRRHRLRDRVAIVGDDPAGAVARAGDASGPLSASARPGSIDLPRSPIPGDGAVRDAVVDRLAPSPDPGGVGSSVHHLDEARPPKGTPELTPDRAVRSLQRAREVPGLSLRRALVLVDYHIRRHEVARRAPAQTWMARHQGVKLLPLQNDSRPGSWSSAATVDRPPARGRSRSPASGRTAVGGGRRTTSAAPGPASASSWCRPSRHPFLCRLRPSPTRSRAADPCGKLLPGFSQRSSSAPESSLRSCP
jgi:hypothetical protein